MIQVEQIRVLVVDDSKIIRERLEEMLSGIDHVASVTKAIDYHSAVEMVKQTSPDVVLLDINLPGRSGLEILREIKNINKNTRVIMITNTSIEYYRELCTFLGAEYFIDKSNEFEKIPGIINSI